MIEFINIWEDKILSTIRTFLNEEFAGTIPIYTGDFKDMGNQSIRLNPIKSVLTDITFSGETREYTLDVSYTFKKKLVKKDTWEHIMRQVSHIEALFHNNMNNTFFNGRLINCLLDAPTKEESLVEGINVVRWEWSGMYLGNIS